MSSPEMSAAEGHEAQKLPKPREPAVPGWFTMDFDEPRLLGSRCSLCGTYFFPKPSGGYCRNPHCDGTELEEAPLSRTGRLWSFTENRYQPPAPYVSPDPFQPYVIAAVELAHEDMVVLGQMTADTDVSQLHAGDEVELLLDTLYEDENNEYVVWKWRALGDR